MRRALVIAVALCLFSLPFTSVAQQARTMYHIGWLAPGPPLPGSSYFQFLKRAEELGYVVGKNLSIDYRSFQLAEEGKAVAGDLVRSKVDLVIAQAPSALFAARTATQSIPIITFYIGDPIRMGVVKSLALPGGNITGFTWDTGPEWVGKSLQLINEVVPRRSKIAFLWNLENDSHPFYVKQFEDYARTLGFSTLSLGVRRTEDLETAFKKMVNAKAAVLVIFTDPFSVRNRERLTTLLNKYPVPAVWGTTTWPLSGALITFGPNVTDQAQGVAEYMDKIFKGASPAELPFQQPMRFDLIINVKIAKSLGLKLPQSLLLRADKLIEQ